MAVFKCKMCGGTLDITAGTTVVKCDYCDTTQTVPSADDDKKIALFTRANRLRAGNEFDKASGIYESIVADFPEEAEAYWGLVLCKYGVEYVDDPATGKKIPTCHRSSFESVMDDNNFELTLEYADAFAKRVYREEAKQLEEIRKGIIEVSSKEEPYDIFICYKETDEHGDRTIDSVLAQDIYDVLTEKGYRTFFARITLEDKLGQEYEPYIFAALNTAKIMLAVGTSFEHYDAVWVKNEWSRFLKLMASDKTKHLIPCFKNLDAYDMPKEFAKLQAQDLGKVGATQDLLRGIEKILPKQKAEVVYSTNHSADPLVKRGFIYLEDNDFVKADEYFDKALDEAPDNGDAYLGKVLALLKLSKIDDLCAVQQDLTQLKDFKRAVRFSVGGNKAILDKINENLCKKNEIRKLVIGIKKVQKIKELEAKKEIEARQEKEVVYKKAKAAMDCALSQKHYNEAATLFKSIGDYKDSVTLAQTCEKIVCDIISLGNSRGDRRRIDEQRKQAFSIVPLVLEVTNSKNPLAMADGVEFRYEIQEVGQNNIRRLSIRLEKVTLHTVYMRPGTYTISVKVLASSDGSTLWDATSTVSISSGETWYVVANRPSVFSKLKLNVEKR